MPPNMCLNQITDRLKHYTVFAGTTIRFCNDATSVFLYTQPGVSCRFILKTQDKQARTLAKPGPCNKHTLSAKKKRIQAECTVTCRPVSLNRTFSIEVPRSKPAIFNFIVCNVTTGIIIL